MRQLWKREVTRVFDRFRNVSLATFARDCVRAVRLHLRSPHKNHRSDIEREFELVITLSTIPSRLANITPTLNSLIDQQVPADRIVLAVPWHSLREDVPYSDHLLETLPDRVTVLRCDDVGPATKVLPALKQYPDAVVVVVDDDVIYPSNFIKVLQETYRLHPNAACGYRGVQLDDTIPFADLTHVFATGVSTATLVDVLFGTWGYLIPPTVLSDDIHDFSKSPPEIRWVDDVWISGHLAKSGVERLVTHAQSFPIETLSSFRHALTDGKNKSGANDQTAIEYFREYWDDKQKSQQRGNKSDL